MRSVSSKILDGARSPEWVTYGHDYSNQRFSPLSQINSRNVSNLAPVYVFQTGVLGPFEATPIIFDGVMYVSTAYDGVYAINASNGELLWRRSPLSGTYRGCCGPVSRGVAVTQDLVLIGQLDGVLVALDRHTGEVKWARMVAENTSGYSITMAPIVYRRSVIVGVAGSEFGIRGSVSAYSTSDGKLMWRWYSTDAQHWFGTSPRLLSDDGRLDLRTSMMQRERFKDSWKRGGGGVWTTPAIDPARNTIYVTTGNPWPDTNGTRRPGDNLYTDSIVALDASTGHLKWYFQQTPHDVGDLDAASPPILFSTIDSTGREVPAVGEIGKTGLLYVIDRVTGRLIRRSDNVAYTSASTRNSRQWEGGSGWSPASFDPRMGYLIVTAAQHLKLEAGSVRTHTSSESHVWNSGYGTVSAVDPATGRLAWQDQFDEGLVGGSVSTAGGLTFVGEGNGYFDALDSKTGARLWRFQTGAGVNAAPVVFEIGDREYVAVASGGNQQFGTRFGDAVFVFGLNR